MTPFTPRAPRWLLPLLAAALAGLAACDSDPTPTPDAGTADVGTTGDAGADDFECTADRVNWEQCKDGKVQWCHVLEGMLPHFHWGTDCTASGLQCVELSQSDAVCVDGSKPCTAGSHRCESNTAYNCVDGKTSVEACGTAKTCHDEQDGAHCEALSAECSGHGHLHDGECHCDTGYTLDPADKTKCVSDVDFPTEACNLFGGTAAKVTPATSFAKFDEAHVELDHPFEVALPDQAAAYVHFDAPRAGEYVVFLGATGAFDALLDPDEKALATSGGVANGKCPAAIVDHHHGEVTPAAGEPAVIIRFKAGAARSVKVLVRLKPSDACSGHGTLASGECQCDAGYKQDPADKTKCIAKEFPELSCDLFASAPKESVTAVSAFADFGKAHAELDHQVTVTLPANQQGFIHFPTLKTAEYVVFLDTPGVLDEFLDKTGAVVAKSGGVANGKCADVLKDHWHAELAYSGNGTDPIPAVLRFKAGTVASVKLLIRVKDTEEPAGAGRLAITEQNADLVRVLDLDTGDLEASHSLQSTPSAVYSSPGGRYAVVVQASQGLVQFIDGGVWQEDHGDHVHDYQQPSTLLAHSLTGKKPSHFDVQAGVQASMYFDGDATATPAVNAGMSLLTDTSIGAGGALATLSLAVPLHGFAEPVGDKLLSVAREADASDALPTHLTQYQRSGASYTFVRQVPTRCDRMHGSFTSGTSTVAGCNTGVLLVKHLSATSVSDGQLLATPLRVSAIAGHPGLPDQFIAIASEGTAPSVTTRFYAVDGTAGTVSDFVPEGWATGRVRRAHGFDRTGQRFFILDDQGTLIVAQRQGDHWGNLARITGAVPTMPTAAPWPAFAASGAKDVVFLSDPSAKQLLVLDSHTGATGEHRDLGYVPSALTWLGVAR